MSYVIELTDKGNAQHSDAVNRAVNMLPPNTEVEIRSKWIKDEDGMTWVTTVKVLGA